MNLRNALLYSLLVLGAVGCGPTEVGADTEEQKMGRVAQGVCTVTPMPAPAPCNMPGIGPVQFVCDVITQNTACDQIANLYYGSADQLVNAQCNRNNNAAWLASLNIAIDSWAAVRDNANSYEESICAQMHIDEYVQLSMQAAQMVWFLDMQIACLHNTLAESQCELARCMATPACKPVLARGPGGPGAACVDGGECQSGLCLAGTNTCARPPIDYCCLAPTNNQCPNFQQNLDACWMRIQRETSGYPYP